MGARTADKKRAYSAKVGTGFASQSSLRRLRRLICGRIRAKTMNRGHFPALLETALRQNLDAPPLSPYTSAAPLMDVILNPRAALYALFGSAGDGRGF